MFKEYTLPTAALAYNRRNLILINFKIRLVENSLFVKALYDISEFYQGRFHWHLYMKKHVTT